jgi:ribonuclease P protein component
MNALQKPQPLRKSRQFRSVYNQGQKFHAPFFTVFIGKNDAAAPRIGITVTRKIGNAVVRNRCKRRLREIVRRYFATVATEMQTSGYDLVINVKTGLVEAEFKQIEEAFARTMTKVHDWLCKQEG